jgi:hypothetical protein
MKLDFNKIYVIESLSANETKTGTNLENDIIRRRLWNHDGITSKLYEINSKSEFYSLLSNIESEVLKDNVIPYLHFEIHGNPDGFLLNSDEQINWYEFRPRLTQINFLSRNKLWISLATCYGAYLYSTYSIVSKAPFYGYVGAWSEINIQDLSVSYERFFEKLLQEFNIEKAVKALNLSNPNLPVEYKLYNSQDVFNKTYDAYEKDKYSPKGFKERLDTIVRQGLSDPRNKNLKLTEEFIRDFAKKTLLGEKERFRKYYYDQFMMIDKFPEIKERFK